MNLFKKIASDFTAKEPYELIKNIVGYFGGLIIVIAIFSAIITAIYPNQFEGMAYSFGPELSKNNLEHNDLNSLLSDDRRSAKLRRVVIWNNGKNSISRDMISLNSPITIITQDSIKILDAKIVKQSRDELKFKLLVNDNSVQINLISDSEFEENDGLGILLKYTNLDDDSANINFYIEGDIKGIREDFRIIDYKHPASSSKFYVIILDIGICIICCLILYFIARGFIMILKVSKKKWYHYLSIPLVLIIILLVIIFSIGRVRHIPYANSFKYPEWYEDEQGFDILMGPIQIKGLLN